MTLAEPLRFEPQACPKVWGGRRLEAFLQEDLGLSGPVGEVLTLVDRENGTSRVAEGTFQGRSLGGLMLSEREALLGSARPSRDDRFPLLVKYLDASRDLSIQVHPDPVAARRLGAESKEECWYVLDADPGAELYLGLRPGVDAAAFAAAAGTSDVVDLLASHPAKAGSFFHVPAGTVHGIGGGVSLVEIQENADTTYRIFDWDRPGLDGELRELHIPQALASIDYERELVGEVHPTPDAGAGVNRSVPILAGPSFSVDLLSIHEPLQHDTAGLPLVYVVLSGGGALALPGREGVWKLRRGQTWLVPASVGEHRFESLDGNLEVLRAVAPQQEALQEQVQNSASTRVQRKAPVEPPEGRRS